MVFRSDNQIQTAWHTSSYLPCVQERPDQAFMLHHDLDGAALARSMGQTSQGSPTGTLPLEDRFRRSLPPGATFKNPILPAPSADPWVLLHDGNYYSCESRKQESIWIPQPSCFTELNHSEATMV